MTTSGTFIQFHFKGHLKLLLSDGNSLTYSRVYTEEVILPVIFGGIGGPGGPSENNNLMMENFGPPKVKAVGVQLREVYSKDNNNYQDHHWLTAEYLDPSDQIIATAGISLGSQPFKFTELGHVYMNQQGQTQFALESKVQLSGSQAKAVDRKSVV